MSIAEKLQTIAENEQKVYDAGKSSAVMSGTITFTNTTKVMTITGLPSKPKELNMVSTVATFPTDDNQYFIRGLDYYAEGFTLGTSSSKIVSSLWLIVNENVSATGAANGSISERIASKNNVFTFENGTFTIDLSYNSLYFFGENYSYKWTAVF